MTEQELINRLRSERPSPPAGFGARQDRLLRGLMQKEEPKMKRKMSFGLVLALILALLSMTAFAASLVFSPKADIARLADRALEEQYGITDEMQVYFHRAVDQKKDGSAVVTYTGNWELRYVLGEYTVTVHGKDAKAVWSHDGEDTSGGLDAAAWGVDQLNEMMRLYKETHDMSAYIDKAEAVAAKRGAAVENPLFTPESERITEEEYLSRQDALRAKSKLTEAELLAIARQAVESTYSLNAEQMDKLAHNPGLSAYLEADGRLMYETCMVLIQQPSDDPNVYPEYVQMDGEYIVLIDTVSGVVEDIRYDAELAGNG